MSTTTVPTVSLDVWVESFENPEGFGTKCPCPSLSCPHERKVLVESGYEREWEWTDHGDGTYEAFENYPSSYSEEGNGEHRLMCKTCLKEFPLPDDWVEGVNFA